MKKYCSAAKIVSLWSCWYLCPFILTRNNVAPSQGVVSYDIPVHTVQNQRECVEQQCVHHCYLAQLMWTKTNPILANERILLKEMTCSDLTGEKCLKSMIIHGKKKEEEKHKSSRPALPKDFDTSPSHLLIGEKTYWGLFIEETI